VLSSFFMNYDVSETISAGRDLTTRRDLGALLELGGMLASAVGHDLPSRVATHGPRTALA
jgi:hypothetical protein